MVDTETGWYGYAAPTPAQPYYPEQDTAYYGYAAYPVYQDPMPQQQYPQEQYTQQQQYVQEQYYYPTEPLAAYEQEFAYLPEPELQFEPEPELEPEAEPELEPELEPVLAAPVVVTGGRAAARVARGRTKRRRSAVLTIAVPSVAVLGIAGAAAATLAPEASSHPVAANDASKPLTANDQKAKDLAAAQAKASAEQVSRDQARQALTLRTAAAKKAAAEAPRYVMPITAHTGLSALYGQAGTHWMSLHTGIDFPVSTGTQVHAVTNGTISTKWNAYYGNMLILTAPDGTQTWYCHLSAYKKRSGSVKAGDVVAYSGDTGNSTGPHMHFEVHPNGGVAIDPLPWLLSHGLDPR
ncbi:M23 family metallopeptidase [Streptacidiphilus sp. PAMC 29251]